MSEQVPYLNTLAGSLSQLSLDNLPLTAFIGHRTAAVIPVESATAYQKVTVLRIPVHT